MRGKRRSPGPPHPPGGFRRDDRRYPTAPRERRRRSLSPDRFRRGSPPPFKRGRYGREQDDFYPPRGYNHGYYGRPSPPPRDSRRDGPRPYKDFCRTLPDDVTPEEAQKEYQQYLSEYWGSEVRADFESKKNEEWMKRRFDPRGMRKAMEERNEEAQKAATAFSEDVKAGVLDPKSEDFNQGSGLPGRADDADGAKGDEDKEGDDGEGKPAEPEVPTAPDLVWKPERIISDFRLSRQLLVQLDQEKGIEGAEQLFGPLPAAEDKPANPEPGQPDGGQAVANGQADTGAEKGAAPAADAPTEESKGEGATSKEEGDAGDVEEMLAKLDLQLSYLWRVHAVDYYAGKEHADPLHFGLRNSTARMLRGPRPEEGEQVPEGEEKKSLKQVEKRVDQVWKKRIVAGDPFENSLQKDKVDKQIEDWIEDQVKRIDEQKWGCKLSQKLFVGKDYVLKHVRLKHSEKVDEKRSQICEDIFWENYKKFREEEQKMMQDQLAKMQQAMQIQQGGLPMPWDGTGAAPQAGPAAEGFAGGFNGAFHGGVPPMRAPPMMPQRQLSGGVVLPGGLMPQPGQMLVLAPGAGPMGPFISVPISEAAGYGGRGAGPPRPPPRGPAGGRGRGFFNPPFMGGGPDPRGVRGEYYDLDNPSNNRAVLDYGDL